MPKKPPSTINEMGSPPDRDAVADPTAIPEMRCVNRFMVFYLSGTTQPRTLREILVLWTRYSKVGNETSVDMRDSNCYLSST